MFHAVDHRARIEEEQCLEECVGDQMKCGSNICADPQSCHHETKLRNGGVCQDTLNIILSHCNGSGEKSSERPNKGDHAHGGIQRHPLGPARRDEREHADDHVYTRRNHCGGMDHGADRGGSFHGIGQPHMERKLGGFSDRPNEQEQPNNPGRGKPKKCRSGR